MAFNKSQKKAIEVKKGPTIVLAGPGSGKTTVITEHTKFLLENNLCNDEDIMVVTFTKNAAKEMQIRFNDITDNKYPNVTFGTFHSIYFQIAKEKYNYNETNVIEANDRTFLLKNIVKRLSIDIKDEKEYFKVLSNEISKVKCEFIDIDNYISPVLNDAEFRLIYKEYQREMEENVLIDYDDMLLLCHKVLVDCPEILDKYQTKFKHILVDEFQDTNDIQFEVVKMLALPENNLFVVGDDDQSIYKFRGAKPEIMLKFPEIYPKCKTINLDINYRSTPQIVDGAKIVIANNKNRYDKVLNANKTTGEDIYIETVSNQYYENTEIVNKIKENIALGIKPNQIAIIYRTNIQTRTLTEALLKENIPFYVRDGVSNIYEHWIAKEIFAYVQLAMGKAENVHLYKIINKPKRYVENKCINSLDDVTIDNIIEYYKNNSEKDWLIDGLIKLKGHLETLQTIHNPKEIIEYVINDIGYMEYLKEYSEKTKDNLEELTLILDELVNTAQNYETCEEWFEYIANYTKEVNEIRSSNNKTNDAINLMTMHASKGLEFDVVFIIDANEGVTPSYRAKTDEDIEEERRMFYVAMTRAKTRLYIYVLRNKNDKEIEPSRFVKELKHGLKLKREATEKEKIEQEFQKTQELRDKLTLQENITPQVNIDDILKEDKPQPLATKPIIDGINTDKEVYHKTYKNGFVQEDKDGILKIYFVDKAKIIVLRKSYCEQFNMLYEF